MMLWHAVAFVHDVMSASISTRPTNKAVFFVAPDCKRIALVHVAKDSKKIILSVAQCGLILASMTATSTRIDLV